MPRKPLLTKLAYEAILRKQGGGCAICGRPPAKRRLHTDHDHKTGKIRGLLCYRHNYGLTWFQDNPALLRRAAAYLEERR